MFLYELLVKLLIFICLCDIILCTRCCDICWAFRFPNDLKIVKVLMLYPCELY